MKIRDLLSEAISITPHKQDFEKAIHLGLIKGFRLILMMRGKNPRAESSFSEGFTNMFKSIIHRELYDRTRFMTEISIRNICDGFLGRKVVDAISFEKIEGSTLGLARHRTVVINDQLFNQIFLTILTNLFNMAMDSGNEKVSELYNIVKKLESGDSTTVRDLFNHTHDLVYNIIQVLVHELTHIVQLDQQKRAGRTGIEYRSYLDKNKDEFRNANIKKFTADQPSNMTPDRYRELYLSSPQEIAAFAQQMASSIIRHRGLDDAELTRGEFLDLIKDIKSQDISAEISNTIGRFNRTGKLRIDHKVYQRYVKLIYLEIQRYIESRLKSL